MSLSYVAHRLTYGVWSDISALSAAVGAEVDNFRAKGTVVLWTAEKSRQDFVRDSSTDGSRVIDREVAVARSI